MPEGKNWNIKTYLSVVICNMYIYYIQGYSEAQLILLYLYLYPQIQVYYLEY